MKLERLWTTDGGGDNAEDVEDDWPGHDEAWGSVLQRREAALKALRVGKNNKWKSTQGRNRNWLMSSASPFDIKLCFVKRWRKYLAVFVVFFLDIPSLAMSFLYFINENSLFLSNNQQILHVAFEVLAQEWHEQYVFYPLSQLFLFCVVTPTYGAVPQEWRLLSSVGHDRARWEPTASETSPDRVCHSDQAILSVPHCWFPATALSSNSL
jgi:hypothetical protein